MSVWQGSTTAAKVDGTFGPCVSAMRHACREETPHVVVGLPVRRGAIKCLIIKVGRRCLFSRPVIGMAL